MIVPSRKRIFLSDEGSEIMIDGERFATSQGPNNTSLEQVGPSLTDETDTQAVIPAPPYGSSLMDAAEFAQGIVAWARALKDQDKI